MGTLSNSSANRPQLSIVIPAFNEEGNLREVCNELFQVLSGLNMSWEIIFADDGSKDATWNEIISLHNDEKRVKGIRLSRNFGHQYALLAGLIHACGEAVISMDADFQHPPDIIPKLIDDWKAGNKIVNTIRLDPEDWSVFKKFTSEVFYKLFSYLSGVKMERGMADFRLLDRQVLDEILRFPENSLFLRGIVQWIGYPSSNVEFQCRDRLSGVSKYSMRKMFKFAFSGIISFSLIPLRISIVVGMLTSVFAFVQGVYAVYIKMFTGEAVPGWATVVCIISFLLGIMFIILGVLGEYIGRVLIEVKRRPRFFASETIGVKHSFTDMNEDYHSEKSNLHKESRSLNSNFPLRRV